MPSSVGTRTQIPLCDRPLVYCHIALSDEQIQVQSSTPARTDFLKCGELTPAPHDNRDQSKISLLFVTKNFSTKSSPKRETRLKDASSDRGWPSMCG